MGTELAALLGDEIGVLAAEAVVRCVSGMLGVEIGGVATSVGELISLPTEDGAALCIPG